MSAIKNDETLASPEADQSGGETRKRRASESGSPPKRAKQQSTDNDDDDDDDNVSTMDNDGVSTPKSTETSAFPTAALFSADDGAVKVRCNAGEEEDSERKRKLLWVYTAFLQ